MLLVGPQSDSAHANSCCVGCAHHSRAPGRGLSPPIPPLPQAVVDFVKQARKEVDLSLYQQMTAEQTLPNAPPHVPSDDSEDLEPCEDYQIITSSLILVAEEHGAQDVACVIMYVAQPKHPNGVVQGRP